MFEFSGRWSTTFGTLVLTRRGARVSGTYRYRGVEGDISGLRKGNVLRFHYVEQAESSGSEFRLLREGRFTGSYRPKGTFTSRPWSGHRGWDGLWDTDFGRLRLFQHLGDLRGSYSSASHAELNGQVQGVGLVFRYSEAHASGTGAQSRVARRVGAHGPVRAAAAGGDDPASPGAGTSGDLPCPGPSQDRHGPA